jgi:peptide subunit release factor 1 (eRF1)
MDDKEKTELEEFVERMKAYRARHTELITVYVPKGFDINLITKQLESEKSTAANIKSTATRKNVQEALESLIRIAKNMKQTPANGAGLFAGNVSTTEGQDDFITEVFEPPEELGVRLYRCDQTFVIDPLDEMLEEKEVYGLIAIERNEASIGILIGKKIKMIQNFDSYIPGKTNKGGQCLSSDTHVIVDGKDTILKNVEVGDIILGYDFEDSRITNTECVNKWKVNKNKIFNIKLESRDSSIIASEDHLFFVNKNKEVVEKASEDLQKEDFLINSKGLPTKIVDIFVEDKETDLIDIETKNHNFIANGLIVHNSSARYSRIRDNMAKEFYRKVAEVAKQEFFNMKNLKGILVGGPGPTKEEFLKEGNLVTELQDKIIGIKDIGYADEHGLELLVEVSGDVLEKQEIMREKNILEKFFNMLGKEREKTAYGKEQVKKALSFGAVDMLLLSKKLNKKDIKNFEKKAEDTSCKVELISNETEEGIQFYNLGGIGAILRFKI